MATRLSIKSALLTTALLSSIALGVGYQMQYSWLSAEVTNTTATASTLPLGNYYPEVSDRSFLTPATLPAGATFSANAYVKDLDGTQNIKEVSIDLSALGLERVVLTAEEKDTQGQWFRKKDILIPRELISGIYFLEVRATDQKNYHALRRLSVTVTGGTVGNTDTTTTSSGTYGKRPRVQKIYSDPVTIDRGKTGAVMLYALIQDNDGADDIKRVEVNLASVEGEASVPMERVEKKDPTTVLYAYNLSGTETLQGSRYMIGVKVTDKANYTGEGTSYLNVEEKVEKGSTLSTGSTSGTETTESETVEVIGSSVVAKNTIEFYFKTPLDVASLRATGEQFRLAKMNNLFATKSIKKLAVNSEGTVVRLEVNGLEKNEFYAMWIQGVVRTQDGKKVNLKGKPTVKYIEEPKRYLMITDVTPKDPTHIEVTFEKPLLLSSLTSNGEFCTISHTIPPKGGNLDVQKVEILSEKKIRLTTERQYARRPYRLTCKDIKGVFGSAFPGNTLERSFQGYSEQWRADFDSNGTVDFKDFTIFAVEYAASQLKGTTLDEDTDSSASTSSSPDA